MRQASLETVFRRPRAILELPYGPHSTLENPSEQRAQHTQRGIPPRGCESKLPLTRPKRFPSALSARRLLQPGYRPDSCSGRTLVRALLRNPQQAVDQALNRDQYRAPTPLRGRQMFVGARTGLSDKSRATPYGVENLASVFHAVRTAAGVIRADAFCERRFTAMRRSAKCFSASPRVNPVIKASRPIVVRPPFLLQNLAVS